MHAHIALRRARHHARLSQRVLAAQTGVAQPTIARIELGLADPKVSTLDRLLRSCGYTLDVRVKGGVGIDRSLIAGLLDRSPAERLQSIADDAAALEKFPIGLANQP